MEWTGGCLCGDIRYRITKDPEWAGHCHCSICRKQSGAPYTTGVQFAIEAFEWTKGEPVHFRDQVGADRGILRALWQQHYLGIACWRFPCIRWRPGSCGRCASRWSWLHIDNATVGEARRWSTAIC